ncbi:MAG TPA: multiubiquitin domain-containing protein [Hanamia sp.]
MENEIKDHGDHGNKVLNFTIDGKEYSWNKEYITSAEIRKLAHIPDGNDIWLAIKKPWENELINNDTSVNLARPEIEHFISKQKHADVEIIINGRPVKWDKKQITFVEVITIAYGEYIDKPTMVYTVGYEDGPKENREGSMYKGATVCVKNKMIFHATATDKS